MIVNNKVLIFIGGFILGGSVCLTSIKITSLWNVVSVPEETYNHKQPRIETHHLDGSRHSIPQVYNFMKEFGCREGHMGVPKILQTDLGTGIGKVVVDIGLNDGKEFFAAINSGYTVYGFEANPLSVIDLRKKCKEYDGKTHGPLKCIYVNAKDITEHLHPINFTSYLIEGGAGSSSTVLNMSISGFGSSFVEDAPHKKHPIYRMVTVIPVHKVVDTDVYLFKLDVQGFEYDVLKGSKTIFDQKIVKTMLMEVYPRGLGNAGIDFEEFLHFLWHDLGMLCSSADPVKKTTFPMNHPNSLPDLSKYLESLTNATG
jgi:FkbM family methyltransferase